MWLATARHVRLHKVQMYEAVGLASAEDCFGSQLSTACSPCLSHKFAAACSPCLNHCMLAMLEAHVWLATYMSATHFQYVPKTGCLVGLVVIMVACMTVAAVATTLLFVFDPFHGCKHFLVKPTAASSWWSPQWHDCFLSQLTTACSPCMMLVQKLAGLASIMVGSSITCVARHHVATITGCSSCHDTAAHDYNSCL